MCIQYIMIKKKNKKQKKDIIFDVSTVNEKNEQILSIS